jgi:hypothetical protein
MWDAPISALLNSPTVSSWKNNAGLPPHGTAFFGHRSGSLPRMASIERTAYRSKPNTSTMSRKLPGTPSYAMRCDEVSYSDIMHIFFVTERLESF